MDVLTRIIQLRAESRKARAEQDIAKALKLSRQADQLWAAHCRVHQTDVVPSIGAPKGNGKIRKPGPP